MGEWCSWIWEEIFLLLQWFLYSCIFLVVYQFISHHLIKFQVECWHKNTNIDMSKNILHDKKKIEWMMKPLILLTNLGITKVIFLFQRQNLPQITHPLWFNSRKSNSLAFSIWKDNCLSNNWQVDKCNQLNSFEIIPLILSYSD